MEFSNDWKSLWAVSSASTAPLLLSGAAAAPLGPLTFNPVPHSHSLLFSSNSLSPRLPPPPLLSLSSFLRTSFVPPSTSSFLAASLGHQRPSPAASLSRNRLRLLPYPSSASLLAFFPTGSNSDRVGFVVLSVGDGSNLAARGCDGGDVFAAGNKLTHRITDIVPNPVASSGNLDNVVGYLLACTLYSIHWYCVRRRRVGDDEEGAVLEYLGEKVFRSSAVVNACWSPHLPEESVVLLESGELFLFNLDSCSKSYFLNRRLRGLRLRVPWNDSGGLNKFVWLGCEFSWHPRIFIVARSDAVFLVDLRYEECNVSCLMKIDVLDTNSLVEKDRFIAFSKAGFDGFYFTVASKGQLLLCDVRKPAMPVLQWVHCLSNPCYIDVFKLSDLRANLKDDRYMWASESGFGIVMGSFWNCEFGLFCYGPPVPAREGNVTSKISKFSKYLCAWELPSELILSGRGCPCGNCLIQKEFSKDALPEWIDWQQKEEFVLGFGILSKDLSALLPEIDNFGGFTLIRLMSSGKLESQRYRASWDCVKKFEEPYTEFPLQFKDSLLYSLGDEEYKFPKRFKYVKLNYLNGFLNGNLTDVMVSSMRKQNMVPWEKKSFKAEFHELLCEKLKAFGIIQSGSSPAASEVFSDISLPTSIHEVVLRKLWASLPMNLLLLAFSSYSEFLEVLVDKRVVSLDFLVVPDRPQLPPFFLREPSCRSNKWSLKVQRGNALVGPVLPLPVLLVLFENHQSSCSYLEEKVDGYSSNIELTHQCNEVMAVASGMAISESGPELQNDHTVSLANNREEPWVGSQIQKPFFIYNQVLLDERSAADPMHEDSVCKDEKYTALICKTPEKPLIPNDRMERDEPIQFDDLCPVALKYDACDLKFGPKELKSFKLLKRQYSKWQEGFNLYQEFCSRYKFHK